ncbi:unnamed protein product [Toxocara canis]|uniref:Secreted protein n=1 Tax=Toxocara canis TaxID=6265 RepID=A0A183UVF2_TOXCA|nr:unnamed protein product [Toxocara canis]
MVKQWLTLLGALLSMLMPTARAYPLIAVEVAAAAAPRTVPTVARALAQQDAQRFTHAQVSLCLPIHRYN